MQQLHRHLMRFPSVWRVVASGRRVSFAPNVPEPLGNARSRLASYLAAHSSVRWELWPSFRPRAMNAIVVALAPSWRHAVSRSHPVLTIGTHLPTSSSSNRMAPVWSTLLLRMHSYVTRVAQFRCVSSVPDWTSIFPDSILERDFIAHDRWFREKWQWHWERLSFPFTSRSTKCIVAVSWKI